MVFLLALATVWAAQTYSASFTVKKGGGGSVEIITASVGGYSLLDLLDPLGVISVKVHKGALDAYMNEKKINAVKITVKVREELVKQDGKSRYRMDFTFGPSGAYFNPPLELSLTGKYVDYGADVMLYDENGEELEYERYDLTDTIVFKIPHFSSYTYDHYDY